VLQSEESLEAADLTQAPQTAAGRSERHWYTAARPVAAADGEV